MNRLLAIKAATEYLNSQNVVIDDSIVVYSVVQTDDLTGAPPRWVILFKTTPNLEPECIVIYVNIQDGLVYEGEVI